MRPVFHHVCCAALAAIACLPLRGQGDPRAGVLLPDAAALMRFPAAAGSHPDSALPKQVDLSDLLPPAGDQGTSNSCTGWAVGYGACSAVNAEVRQRTLDKRAPDPTQVFSPAFIYALALQGDPCGDDVYLSDALAVADSLGCCAWSVLPFDTARMDHDCKELPADAMTLARLFRLPAVHRLKPRDKDPVRAALAQGRLVVINANVDTSFTSAGDRAGGTTPYTWRPVTIDSTYGHAMVCMGYDDASATFLVQNSWSTRWGYEGTFRMPYAIYRRYVSEAYAVEPTLRLIALRPANTDTAVHDRKRLATELATGASVQHRELAFTALHVAPGAKAAILRVDDPDGGAQPHDLYLNPREELTVYHHGQAYTVDQRRPKRGARNARVVISARPADRDPQLRMALRHIEHMRKQGAR